MNCKLVFCIVISFVFSNCWSVNGECEDEIYEETEVLLNTTRDDFYWNIDTKPEKYYMKYFNTSDFINKTFIGHPDFDLSPFLGKVGVWAFPYTFKFGERFYAYFTKYLGYAIFDRIDIYYYLEETAELWFFFNTAGSEAGHTPNYTFTSNVTNPQWEVASLSGDRRYNTFRIEIHATQPGDFGFLDAVVGYRTTATRPPPITGNPTQSTTTSTTAKSNDTSTTTTGSPSTTSKKPVNPPPGSTSSASSTGGPVTSIVTFMTSLESTEATTASACYATLYSCILHSNIKVMIICAFLINKILF